MTYKAKVYGVQNCNWNKQLKCLPWVELNLYIMATDKTSTITARIPTDQKEAIAKACKQHGISKSEYIKGLMRLQNEDAEDTAKLLRKNPSKQANGNDDFLKVMGFTVAGVALLKWLGTHFDDPNDPNDLNQFTRG